MKCIIMMLIFAGAVTVQLQAQDSAKQAIKNIIDEKHYQFEPTSMTTGGGRMKQLTTGYFLKINGDTLKVYLPYVGRAYSAPINSSDAGFDFTSTDFTYAVTEGKKDSYVINIKTKDKMYNTDFALTVYDNGTGYLRANNSNKQPVSYNGKLKEKN